MKNKKAGFIIPLLVGIITLLVVGGGVYFYVSKDISPEVAKQDENNVATTSDSSIINTQSSSSSQNKSSSQNVGSLSDEQFTSVIKDDPQAKVIARGDINGDGYEDAIVQVVTCGASCSISLDIVLNDHNSKPILFIPNGYSNFEPTYVGSSAAKSQITNIGIKNGIISLTGYGLSCGGDKTSDSNICTQEMWNVIRTVTYKFDGKKIVQLSINPPVDSSLISNGNYSFEDSSGTSFNLKIADNNKAHLIVTGRMIYEEYNLYYSIKDSRLNVYFDSLDNTNINANAIGKRGGDNKGDEIFVLDKIDNSSYKITWDDPSRWLNNVEKDKDNSFFKKIN